MRRVARASALGAFAGSLAHEINQPLAAAAVNGDAALRWLSADPVNHAKLGVKLGVAAVVVLLVAKNRKFQSIPRGLWVIIGAGTLINAGLAVLWQ